MTLGHCGCLRGQLISWGKLLAKDNDALINLWQVRSVHLFRCLNLLEPDLFRFAIANFTASSVAGGTQAIIGSILNTANFWSSDRSFQIKQRESRTIAACQGLRR